jgi:hypothetical protein
MIQEGSGIQIRRQKRNERKQNQGKRAQTERKDALHLRDIL